MSNVLSLFVGPAAPSQWRQSILACLWLMGMVLFEPFMAFGRIHVSIFMLTFFVLITLRLYGAVVLCCMAQFYLCTISPHMAYPMGMGTMGLIWLLGKTLMKDMTFIHQWILFTLSMSLWQGWLTWADPVHEVIHGIQALVTVLLYPFWVHVCWRVLFLR